MVASRQKSMEGKNAHKSLHWRHVTRRVDSIIMTILWDFLPHPRDGTLRTPGLHWENEKGISDLFFR